MTRFHFALFTLLCLAYQVFQDTMKKNITYDHNGNIMALKRNAILSNVITPVDDLNYTYDGNQLINVTDGTGGSYSQIGFRNLTGSTAAYTYTANGNLSSDPKKGLSLTYNVLNKTDRITMTASTGRYINYSYDAYGNLLRKQVYDNNVAGKVTDYVDGFVYENGTLAYFGMPEGRVRNAGTSLKPEYMIQDYQGNVRVSFEEQGGVAVLRQENSYYPFGLIMPGSNVATPTSANVKLYNGGSEWQNDFSNLPDYYSTFYRNYDPALGRFIGVDPKAEASAFSTTYGYTENNPVMFNDPLGDIKLSQATMYWLSSLFNQSGESGGTWSSETGLVNFQNDASAFNAVAGQLGFGAFGQNGLSGYSGAAGVFNKSNHSGGDVATAWRQLREVSVQSGNMQSYFAAHAEIQRQMDAFANQGGDIARSAFDVSFSNRQDGRGVSLEIYFTNPGYKYSSYQWIQTVSSTPTLVPGLHNPHVDGSRRANGTLINYPFYWETTELPGVG